MILRNIKTTAIACFTAVLLIAGCKKEYFHDTGLSKSNFNGNMLEYFQSNPVLFDTLTQVIKIAGMEKYFTDSAITFFAPADSSIKNTYYYINNQLKFSGQDTLTALTDLKPQFWKNMLQLYMYRGEKGLEDYAQIDVSNIQAFPGEFTDSYSNRIMNIGVIYHDARGMKYKGYRRLTISYIPSMASPYQSWITAMVASCNIRPNNGMVHVLVYRNHDFGFDANQAWLQAKYLGFNNKR